MPEILDIVTPLREAGFALHWLRPRDKMPFERDWSTAPVASLNDLAATHIPNANVGVRLGEPSALNAGGYLYVIDIDIRDEDQYEDALNKLAVLFPDVDFTQFPVVKTGSGGKSRHIYFSNPNRYTSRKLATSDGKHRGADNKWHYDWEIELFGTGKQVVLPPSIHPVSGKKYEWVRPFEGSLPEIDSETLESLTGVQSVTYEFETRDPLTYKEGQLQAELDELPVTYLDDYHQWILLGQALHHQFGGSADGLEVWREASKRSERFDPKDNLARRWRGFGRSRGRPVTMATVRKWVLEERQKRIVDQFDDIDDVPDLSALLGPTETMPDPASDLPWPSLLEINSEGATKSSLHNVKLITSNDPRLRGVMQINEFTQEVVQRRPPGIKKPKRKNPAKPTLQLVGDMWVVKDKVNGDLWSDDRDYHIRAVLEAPKTQGGYGIKITDRDLKAALTLAARDNSFHPVREYLGALEWDGVPRANRLFIDYLQSDDNAYHRNVARLFLVGAVTRIFEPGHKFDYAVIMEGLQGKRKSTFIETLGKSWFAELDGDFHDTKAMVELMQGAWIMEIPELTGFNRSDVRAIKSFISRRKDKARLAYARRAGEFPRQCVFIGSTNDKGYLKDDTGGRRFWPVVCHADEINIEQLRDEVDQIWAEAVVMYRRMRVEKPSGPLPLYIVDQEAQSIAKALQETRRVESSDDALIGRIEAWLDAPVNDGGFDDLDDSGDPVYRDQTCLIEIYVEALGNDIKNYDNSRAQSLGRAMARLSGWALSGDRPYIEKYGRQRTYERLKPL